MFHRSIFSVSLAIVVSLGTIVSAKACPSKSLEIDQTSAIVETTQSDTLSAFLDTWTFGRFGCVEKQTPASSTWISNGGTLQVVSEGTQAIFSSTKTGGFTVTTNYNSFSHASPVKVQSPNESVLSDLGCTQNPTCPAYPAGGLLPAADGAFFGVSAFGGASGNGEAFEFVPQGSGFAIDDLFDFTASSGYNPYGGLIADRSGSLFGNALVGGNSFASCPLVGGFFGCGTVFRLAPSPRGYALTVLYAFQGGSDGFNPSGRLLMGSTGDLFGTTLGGGSSSCGCGTVFRLARIGGAWREFILHRFAGGRDGALPFAGVIADASGNLYGTTASGGGAACPQLGAGCGVVFELVRGRGYTYRILHRFQGKAGGGLPVSGVIGDGTGALYGTTWGPGVVFKLVPTGSGYSETVLHTFSAEASNAMSGLIDVNGTLFGMTSQGGPDGGGVVYSLTPAGASYTYRLLHTFESQSLDGSNFPDAGQFFGFLWPTSPLVFEHGLVIGTTYAGGLGAGCQGWPLQAQNGCGTMFEVSP